MKLKDVSVTDGNWTQISLSKLAGQKVVDIHGHISMEFGEPCFDISRIVLENGKTLFCSGEHDIAYIEDTDADCNLDDETLEDLCRQQDEEEL